MFGVTEDIKSIIHGYFKNILCESFDRKGPSKAGSKERRVQRSTTNTNQREAVLIAVEQVGGSVDVTI